MGAKKGRFADTRRQINLDLHLLELWHGNGLLSGATPRVLLLLLQQGTIDFEAHEKLADVALDDVTLAERERHRDAFLFLLSVVKVLCDCEFTGLSWHDRVHSEFVTSNPFKAASYSLCTLRVLLNLLKLIEGTQAHFADNFEIGLL
mmetsp:Transcript_2235/g.3059  ORF Transcript_2235/g.3059 Transcript_2235/m.3059 type:complete len:147 (+) Transcript_2235:430-870(+)